MEPIIYLNGEFISKCDAKVSVFDHGFLYGDGVFEGIRAYNGRVFKLNEHIERLYSSAEKIELKIPLTKDEMEQNILKTLKKNDLADAYIRVVITRGVGDLGMDPDKCSLPSVIIITDKIVLYPQSFYDKGLQVITAKTRRNYSKALNPSIKSLNYLNNILAKIEAKKANVLEAVMLNNNDFVAECTGDNIFIYKEGVLFTPSLDAGILEGITRAAVINLAHNEGIEVSEGFFRLEDIYKADECFLTGTAAEIIPVVSLDEKKIGEGRPGLMTLKLTKLFRELTRTEGIKINN